MIAAGRESGPASWIAWHMLLIALRRLEGPKSARDYALQFVHHASLDMVSLENLNIDLAIWRWVRGFHATLCRIAS
jgi:hypothetical protein